MRLHRHDLMNLWTSRRAG